jgi:DNA polymerase III epsilon subunit-like protein
MLDLETMGHESYSAIVSIGAIKFNINTGDIGERFYCNVNLQSCLDLGLIVNGRTIMWWLKQNEDARKHLSEQPQISITEALMQFKSFYNEEYYIWGNSARFDCGILQNAYHKAKIELPWDFRKERCLRTLVTLNPNIKINHIPKGVAHNAIDDCINQIQYCCEIWKTLNM